MEKDLFDAKEFIDGDVGFIYFGDCTFKRDFGPIKAGDKFSSVYMDIENSKILCYNGAIVAQEIPVTLQPVWTKTT